MADTRGGARPGSGRKPAREKYATAIAKAEKQIVDKLPSLIGNLLELAAGVTVCEIGTDGEQRVYTKAPDYKANEYLINRILGKPVQQIEQDTNVTGNAGIPTVIVLPSNNRELRTDESSDDAS